MKNSVGMVNEWRTAYHIPEHYSHSIGTDKIGAIDGGSPCHMSSFRNGHLSLFTKRKTVSLTLLIMNNTLCFPSYTL